MLKNQSNQVRIIGGIHRGRKLSFPDLPELRPSGDRVRETLFNWLQPTIQGARCLDLFAGSGALGMEAASRGAKEVVMLDTQPQVIRQLEQNKALLGLMQLSIVQANALTWLEQQSSSFDLVFLDPPFSANLLQPIYTQLQVYGWLSSNALVYFEQDAARAVDRLPTGWTLVKEKQIGTVRFGLVHS